MRGRPGTYSIVARDPASGQLGVAVQSHWFSVGSVVSFAEPGVGAVATQSVVEPAYGPNGLAGLRAGGRPAQVLALLTQADEAASVRQVGMVDSEGRIAVHTGAGCIPEAGHLTGEGFSTQANMMDRPGVPEAMAEAFEGATGALAQRLLAALDGAEAAGGDVRGRQSAALLVVGPDATTPAWEREVDLRVEDAADPLGELRRLVNLAEAYELADRGDDLVAEGRHEEAARAYAEASTRAPANAELLFWSGLGTAQGGALEEGTKQVRAAIEQSPGLGRLLERLPQHISPVAAAVARRLAD